MTDYLIIGNGVAGTFAAESIRKQDGNGNITILTDEDLAFYYRLKLNDFLSGDTTEESLMAKKDQWYRDNNIVLELNSPVTGAEVSEKYVMTKENKKISFDKMLIATGSHSFLPPIKGSEKNGVFSLRNIKDARSIISHGETTDQVVLIGGGLLGLEAGNALRKLEKQVTIVEFAPRLLPRQLDVEGAKRLQTIMEGMGFQFRLGAATEEITGDGMVVGVKLNNGEELSAGMVIISAGVRPNMELAGLLGLDSDKGIKVNDKLETSNPDIFAAGDVAEFRGMPYGIWRAAMEQGKIAGTNMAEGDSIYNGTTMANSLKVAGIDLASAGDIDADNKYGAKVISNENVYRKFVINEDKIIGCIMLGDISGFSKVIKAISEGWNMQQVENEISISK